MLTPIGKRIIVKGVEVTYGNIVYSGSKPIQFQVIAIGDDVTKVKVGNVIYLDKHHGAEIEHNKEKFLVIDEGSILAKLD
jgi:co-chaperonin GroES (HSP10)